MATANQAEKHIFLPHHNSEDVLSSGLVVQAIRGVDDARTRIDPEQSHTDWVHTAIDGEGQAGPLVHVRRFNPQ